MEVMRGGRKGRGRKKVLLKAAVYETTPMKETINQQHKLNK